MSINMKAIYSHGILKPLEPLSLPENQTVLLEVTPVDTAATLLPNDLASLFGVWQGIAVDFDEALAAVRKTTDKKLYHLIRETNRPKHKYTHAKRSRLRH